MDKKNGEAEFEAATGGPHPSLDRAEAERRFRAAFPDTEVPATCGTCGTDLFTSTYPGDWACINGHKIVQTGTLDSYRLSRPDTDGEQDD